METQLKETEQFDIISTLFHLAESGKLSEIETDKYLMAVVKFAIYPDRKDYKVRLKKFKQGISNFLKKLEKTIEMAEQSSDSIVEIILKEEKKLKSLPQFTLMSDNQKIIRFASSLKENEYNFSQAEVLLEKKITRQTLTKKVKEGFLDIKPVYISKTAYIKKEDLIKLYRLYFETDTWGF